LDDCKGIGIRYAQPADVAFVLEMIRELADYEHALDQVSATEAKLTHWLFDERKAECLIASLDGRDAGIALFFTNFSTWEGVPGLFLEDLIVSEKARGHGLGMALFRELAQIVLDRGYTRLEWFCLDWNTPSLDFYQSLGAQRRSDWLPHRLYLQDIERLTAGRR
jgi:GNAT superfamily N-acetyltransferase